MKKGQMPLLALAVSVAVIAVFATILWGILSPMTTLPGTLYNETINFAANNTYYDFGQSSDNVLTVVEVWNGTGTNSFRLISSNYVFDNDNDQIKIYTNGTLEGGTNVTTGNKLVSYTWRSNVYLTGGMDRNTMAYVFTFFILGMLVLAGAYVWTLR